MKMEFMKLFRRKENIQTLSGLDEIKKAHELVNRFKSNFLANMSHELRTPLNAMLGYSEMMLEDAKEDGLKTYSANLEKVIHSGKHLLSLINAILDLSKIEAGNMNFFMEDYRIKTLVDELDSFIKPLLQKNNNSFSIAINTDTEIVHTDISCIRQALLNLLDNANKFTKNGKITLDVSSVGSTIAFSVTDTGVGIPKDYAERLFQSFSQADPSITRKYGGTGLGLYLAKQFCELLGGNLSAKSREGEGSVFTITLPQVK